LPTCSTATDVSTALCVAGEAIAKPAPERTSGGDELPVGQPRSRRERDPGERDGVQRDPAADQRPLAVAVDQPPGERRQDDRHLTHAYQKLDITSREQLADALGEAGSEREISAT
jgi:hypothetical protein